MFFRYFRVCLLLVAVMCDTPASGASLAQTSNGEADEVRQLRQAAEAGDARAQFDLGVRYAGGKGVAPDTAEAARWIALAAAQGLVDAQFNLGLMYADGNGVPFPAGFLLTTAVRP